MGAHETWDAASDLFYLPKPIEIIYIGIVR